jgi:hypothetical protein
MKCRICECSEHDACLEGCSWTAPDLCSTCADFLEVMAAYMMLAGPSNRHTLRDAVLAVRRCLLEVGQGFDDSGEAPEPLIVIAR